MAYFYVKNGGTATGDGGRYASQQTGAWSGTASEYYDSMSAALGATTAPGAGDFICCSSSHAKDYNGDKLLTFSGGVTVISVDNSNRENFLIGAYEISRVAASSYFTLNGQMTFWGMRLKASSELNFGTTNVAHDIRLYNCFLDITVVAGNNVIDFGHYHSTSNIPTRIEVINSQIKFGDVGNLIRIMGGDIRMSGCSMESGSTVPTRLIGTNTTSRHGPRLLMENCDFSICTGNIIDASQKAFKVYIDRCLFGIGFTLVASTMQLGQEVHARSFGSADEYYAMQYQDYYGTVTEDTANYRDATYDGSNGYSYKMVSSANASFDYPLRFPIATKWASANPTVTTEFIHEAQGGGTAGDFTDAEFYTEIESPDATNQALGNVSSAKLADPFTAPADLTNSTDSWTETLTGEVKQKIADTLTSAAGIITVWACLSKASVTNYVCAKIDLS